MKSTTRRLLICSLGLFLWIPLTGCQDDNEKAFTSGPKGVADPKYKGDSSYEQYYKDRLKSQPGPAKEKGSK